LNPARPGVTLDDVALVVFLLVVGVIIAAAWLIDRHDRRQGREIPDGRQIAERIRLARRQRRSARIRLEPGSPRPDPERKPVKRGQ
jgi:hypothetical protein